MTKSKFKQCNICRERCEAIKNLQLPKQIVLRGWNPIACSDYVYATAEVYTYRVQRAGLKTLSRLLGNPEIADKVLMVSIVGQKVTLKMKVMPSGT